MLVPLLRTCFERTNSFFFSSVVRSKIIHALTAGSVTENSATNAWNLNFSNGTLNNNNKNNTNVVRAVCALGEKEIDGWVDAYFDCISNKRTAPQCDRYRTNYEEDLWRLMNEVYNRTYQPSKSLCFVVTRPRLREIFAASFRDRIVQHWIVRRIDPLFEERFRAQGDVSFNCRKGYGSMKAVERLAAHFEEVSQGYSREAWVGKFDIKSFFMSIDKNVLFDLLIPFVKERYKGDDIDTLLWLIDITIRHCPQKLCERRSRPVMWERLAKSKSLFNAPDHVGLAIGNITSQIIANFYLSFFDEWMNAQCAENGARYIRFVDDWAVVAQDKGFIIRLYKSAGEWLKTNLHLQLHTDKFYLQPVTHGVKFVGQVIKPRLPPSTSSDRKTTVPPASSMTKSADQPSSSRSFAPSSASTTSKFRSSRSGNGPISYSASCSLPVGKLPNATPYPHSSHRPMNNGMG